MNNKKLPKKTKKDVWLGLYSLALKILVSLVICVLVLVLTGCVIWVKLVCSGPWLSGCVWQ